jgi:Flp pilus assembly protein protease CpaA
MNPFVFALTVAAVVTVVILCAKHKDNLETNVNYGTKVFFIVLTCTFVLFTFIMGGDTIPNQEIELGEPPF